MDDTLKVQKGGFVRTWWDTGAMGVSILYGIVVKSGPKAVVIQWPNGTRNRIDREFNKGVEDVRPDEIEEASKVFRHCLECGGSGKVNELSNDPERKVDGVSEFDPAWCAVCKGSGKRPALTPSTPAE